MRKSIWLSLLLTACSSSAMPYTISAPTARTGAQHILLGQTMDINTADARDLEALPAIGPALAGRIVQYRKEHGPFTSLSDLTQVPGIGEKLLNRMRPYLHILSKP